MHDQSVIKECYSKGMSEQQAIEMLYALKSYSGALKSLGCTQNGNALNERLTDKPFFALEKERFEGLVHLNYNVLLTAGGTVVKLNKRVHFDRLEYGVIPITLSEIGLAKRMSETSSTKQLNPSQELTGDQFRRVLRKNRIPLSSFATTVNTTIDRLKSLKNDKPVPRHFIQKLGSVYRVELA